MRGSSPIYPYKTWTDNEWHEIHPSEFDSTTLKLRATFHQWAKANRYKLVTRTVSDDTLAIRFVRV